MVTVSGPATEFGLTAVPMRTKAGGYLTAGRTPAQEVRIPILAAVGCRRDPVLCVAAGVHGNEYEGQEAIRLLFDRLQVSSLNGSVIGLPVCNVFAYDVRERESPAVVDGANMGRIFPGNPAGSATERVAHAIFTLITRNLRGDSVFMDLHSAESTYTLLPLAGYRTVDNDARERSERAARVLAGFHLWEIPAQPGRLNSEIAKIGITSIGTETTGGAGCADVDVTRYLAAIDRLMVYMGLTQGAVAVDTQAVAMKPITIFAPDSGYLRLSCATGDWVAAGSLLGTVVGPLGEVRGEIRSPADGLVCGARRVPLVWAKDTCFWLSPEDKSLLR